MTNNTINTDVTMRDPVRTGGAKRFRAGDEILGRYVVESELGQGGMGVVYQCLDKTGGVDVAVKCLPSVVSCNTAEMEDVRKNYQIVQCLVHDNIAVLKTLERDAQGDYFVVMELARGTNLKKWAERNAGVEKLDKKIAILRQIAKALDYAHAAKPRSVIHRDIKPENIMIDDDGHVKVLDFGLAAQVQTSLSHVSMLVTSRSGTAAYKSPEQWKAQPQNAAADQYALAVVAYYLFAGRPPFDSEDTCILKEAVLHDPIPPVDGLPDNVFNALQKALAKDPNVRFADCTGFVSAMERADSDLLLKDRGRDDKANTKERDAVLKAFYPKHKNIAFALVVLCLAGGLGYLRWGNLLSGQSAQDAPVPPAEVAASQDEGGVTIAKDVPVDLTSDNLGVAKAKAFSLAADVERAFSFVSTEPVDFKQSYSSEIRQFEINRKAGIDAKDGARPDYPLAVSFFEKALIQAKSLKAKSKGRATHIRQSENKHPDGNLKNILKVDNGEIEQCGICGGLGYVEKKCACNTCSPCYNAGGRLIYQCGKKCTFCKSRRSAGCFYCDFKGYNPCSDCGGEGKCYQPCQCVSSRQSILQNRIMVGRQFPFQKEVPQHVKQVANGQHAVYPMSGGNSVVRILRNDDSEQGDGSEDDESEDDDSENNEDEE